MALDSYAGLKAAVGDWLNRADLAAVIPDFIAMAEAQLSRRLVMDGPVREMMGRSDAVIDSEFTALPGDFLGLRALHLAGARAPLAFTATGATTLSAQAPASGRLAPPGPYMLFLIGPTGVPSLAKMVTVGP